MHFSPNLRWGSKMGSPPPSSPCPHVPILVQVQLLGEELKEPGAVAAVVLGCAYHTDGGDEQLSAGLGGAVHRHGQTWSHRYVHALRGTRKFRLKPVQAEIARRTGEDESQHARAPGVRARGSGRGPWRSSQCQGQGRQHAADLRGGESGRPAPGGRVSLRRRAPGAMAKPGRGQSSTRVHQPPPARSSPAHAHVLRFAQDVCRGRAEPLLQSRGHTAGGQVRV